MDQTLLQCFLALAMFLMTIVSGIIAYKVLSRLTSEDGEQSNRSSRIISILSCFSGGVFFATSFLDVIPHINENYVDFLHAASLDWTFPVPYVALAFGFFLVYFIEEFCMQFLTDPFETHKTESSKAIPVDTIRSDDDIEEYTNTNLAFLKSLTFAFAMSVHSLLEGVALGVQDETSSILSLFTSLMIHKAIEAFSVTLQLSMANRTRIRMFVFTTLVYSLMTPLGSVLGAILQASSMHEVTKKGLVLVLESMAAGTFIYVTFLEILSRERENRHNSLMQLLSIVIGFVVIATVQLICGGV